MVTQVYREYTESTVDTAIHNYAYCRAAISREGLLFFSIYTLFISLEGSFAVVCAPCLLAQLQSRSLTASLNLLQCAFCA